VGRIFVGFGLFLLTNGFSQSCIFSRRIPEKRRYGSLGA